MALSLLFGRKKSPSELVKLLKESIVVFEKKKDDARAQDKVRLCNPTFASSLILLQAREELTKHLTAMKTILYGSGEVRTVEMLR